MSGSSSTPLTTHILRAIGTLVLAAVVLSIVEPVFLDALPAVLVVGALIGIIRLALGVTRRSGW